MSENKNSVPIIVALVFSLLLPVSAEALTFKLPSLNVENTFAQASDSASGWFDILRSKMGEAVNILPKPAAPTPRKAATPPLPVVLPEPSPEASALPSLREAPPQVSSKIVTLSPLDASVLSRFAGLDNQIARLRELVSRQSDSNSRNTSSLITQVTNNISTGLSFDTAVTHSFSVLQQFTNASSTLFSSQYASTTILCLGDECRTSWPSSSAGAAYPFITLSGTTIQATSSIINFNGGILTSASSTLASTTVTSLLSANATATDLYVGNLASSTQIRANTSFLGFLTSIFGSFINILATGSSTLQSFTATQGTTTSATSTNLYSTDFLATGSTTLQNFFATRGTTTSATSTNLYTTDFLSIGSTTFQKFFASQGTTTSATSTNLYTTDFLSFGSTTLQKFFSWQGTTTSATSTNFATTNFLAIGSTTLQNFFATRGTTTSATSTNLYTTDFLSIGSTTLQKFFSWQGTTTSATSTNLYTTDFLSFGSTTLQKFFAWQGTTTSATSTNLFTTNFLSFGSSTLQNFTASNSTTTQATTTNLYASSVLNIGASINFLGRSTTTLTLTDAAWVIATNTAAAASPLLSFNNSAGTTTIQFFGATTTGLTTGSGMPIASGNFVLIGDGHAPAGLNILKGGLCVDNDGWCTASTSGRISSVSSFIGNADLAEMYQAGEYVEPGDVVAITSGVIVVKATRGGKDRMMGVVSTKPGMVLGAGPDSEGRVGDVPIALTGRVPVKVTTENGVIHAGDYLALSGTTGVAAKSTKAGTVIGQALEDYSGSGVGKILVFVKNSYYSGLPLENFPGLTIGGASTAEAILSALENGAHNRSVISSDLTADRMLAAVEIITPKITAGLISAKTIESPTITALSNRITTEVSTLRAEIGAQNAALASLTERVSALEHASSTPFSLAAVSEAVQGIISSASEWVVGKITATVGIFTKLCIGATCIEEEQLKILLNQAGQSASNPPPAIEPAASSTEPSVPGTEPTVSEEVSTPEEPVTDAPEEEAPAPEPDL